MMNYGFDYSNGLYNSINNGGYDFMKNTNNIMGMGSKDTNSDSDSDGLWDILANAFKPKKPDEKMSTMGSIGNFGKGLFDMFQSHKMMGMYEKTMAANLAQQEAQSRRQKLAYNNQLARGASGRAAANGGVDPLKRMD